MKFGVRECANIVFRAKQETKIGTNTFHVGQPVLYIDTATTSSMEQASSTVYAQGGRGNARLLAWEGDKTLTFTVEDALLSPIGFSILSGAGLFKQGDGANSTKEGDSKDLVHFHVSGLATADGDGVIDVTDLVQQFGSEAVICDDDAPIFVMAVEADGSVRGTVYTGATVTNTAASGSTAAKNTITVSTLENENVMVDFYVDLPGAQVWEADITADTFAGYYYVEADTLFRDQATGKDMPANLTFPNVKIQSNFTISMAGTGDPSTFTFTMDAFPGYTYFDKSKKVLCVLQIAGEATKSASAGNPVMPHNDVDEDVDPLANDSVAANDATDGG